jgi:hypothetical protein
MSMHLSDKSLWAFGSEFGIESSLKWLSKFMVISEMAKSKI